MDKLNWLKTAILMALILVTSGCGRNESPQPAVTGQNTTATPTADLAATHDHQTMVVEGATANALDLVYEQKITDQTATAFADPRPTAGSGTFPTLEPYTPEPKVTDEFRLFTHRECNPSTEWRGPTYNTNCWHGLVTGKDLFVMAGGSNPQPVPEGRGFLKVTEGFETLDYRYPVEQGQITIIAAQLPNLLVSVGGSFNVLFNLETRQWVTATPTLTDAQLNSIKYANDIQYNNDIMTLTAGGQLPTPVITDPTLSVELTALASDTWPTDEPQPTPELGIQFCGYADRNFDHENCWIGINATSYVVVESGSTEGSSPDGLLRVYTETLSLDARGGLKKYHTPTQQGAIKVTQANWPFIQVETLTSPTTQFTFNLETCQWVTPNGTPIPTPR